MKFLLISWCPRGALWYLRVCAFTVQGLWSSSVQNCVSLGVAVCDPNCNKRNNRLFGNEQLRSEDFKGASHSHLHVIVKSSCFPIMVREPTWDSLVGCSNTFCLLLFFMDYSHQSIEWFIPACKDIKDVPISSSFSSTSHLPLPSLFTPSLFLLLPKEVKDF